MRDVFGPTSSQAPYYFFYYYIRCCHCTGSLIVLRGHKNRGHFMNLHLFPGMKPQSLFFSPVTYKYLGFWKWPFCKFLSCWWLFLMSPLCNESNIRVCLKLFICLSTRLFTDDHADLTAPVPVAAAHHRPHCVVHHGDRADVVVLQGDAATDRLQAECLCASCLRLVYHTHTHKHSHRHRMSLCL